MMIAEEEGLKERLLKSIAICQKELNTLCSELHVEPFQVHGRVSVDPAGSEHKGRTLIWGYMWKVSL